jgi:hypothetical protein
MLLCFCFLCIEEFSLPPPCHHDMMFSREHNVFFFASTVKASLVTPAASELLTSSSPVSILYCQDQLIVLAVLSPFESLVTIKICKHNAVIANVFGRTLNKNTSIWPVFSLIIS